MKTQKTCQGERNIVSGKWKEFSMTANLPSLPTKLIDHTRKAFIREAIFMPMVFLKELQNTHKLPQAIWGDGTHSILSVKHGGGSIMLSGCSSARTVTMLSFADFYFQK